GCGEAQLQRLAVYKVQGKVSYQGKSPVGASVCFHPASADKRMPVPPRGVVADDGTFKISTYAADDGAPSGDYVVTISWRKTTTLPSGEDEAGPSLLPAKYESPEKSGLKVTVNATELNDLAPIELR